MGRSRGGCRPWEGGLEVVCHRPRGQRLHSRWQEPQSQGLGGDGGWGARCPRLHGAWRVRGYLRHCGCACRRCDHRPRRQRCGPEGRQGRRVRRPEGGVEVVQRAQVWAACHAHAQAAAHAAAGMCRNVWAAVNTMDAGISGERCWGNTGRQRSFLVLAGAWRVCGVGGGD